VPREPTSPQQQLNSATEDCEAEFARTTSTEATVAQLLAHESAKDVIHMRDCDGLATLEAITRDTCTTSTPATVAQVQAYVRRQERERQSTRSRA